MANHAVSNRAGLRERTKTMSRHGDHRGQIADFRDSFETINWLYLLFKCGIKTKTHFEWLLWHWSSLGQLNLEPTQPNGLVGCKVPTDLVKISVKEATHMGFYYMVSLVCDLNRTPVVMAKHGGSCVHFSGISTCGRTSWETVSHPQHPPLPTLYKIFLPVYVIVTNKQLQPLTTTWYNSLVLSFSLLKVCAPCIVEGSALSFADGAAEVLQVQVKILYCLLYISRRVSRFMQ